MTGTEKYTPLSERLQQDVWHDNFVPKYSALASAKPSLLVLIGVWLIFAPMVLLSMGMVVSAVAEAPDMLNAILPSFAPMLFLMLGTVILAVQTQRYRVAKRNRPGEEIGEEFGEEGGEGYEEDYVDP